MAYGKTMMKKGPKGSYAMAKKGRKGGKMAVAKARRAASPASGPCNARAM